MLWSNALNSKVGNFFQGPAYIDNKFKVLEIIRMGP